MSDVSSARFASPMPGRVRPWTRIAWGLACGCLLAGMAAAQADPRGGDAALRQPASEARASYEIPGGTLEQALSRFALQSGISLIFEPALVLGLRSTGLSGRYSVQEGFAALLAGSRLLVLRRAEGGYTLIRQPDAGDGTLVLDAMRVEGVLQPDAQDLPYATAGSSSHITRERIERFRGTSVGDIFQGTPGVLVGENRNSGGLDVNIRGMQGQGRVPVLVDGARQEATVYRGYAGVASRSYVDPDLIGSIEIEKGPTMNASGTGAVGGLVSARTIGANDIVKDGRDFGIRLRGSLVGNNSGSPAPAGTPVGYNVRAGAYRTDCRLSEASCGGIYDLAGITAPTDTLDRPGTLDMRGWAGSLAVARRLESIDLVAAYATRRQGNYYAGKHGPTPWIDDSDTSPGRFWTDVRPVLHGASRFRPQERVVNSNYESASTLLKSTFHLPDDHQLEVSWLRYHSEHGELMPSQLSGVVSGTEGTGFIRQTGNSRITANTFTGRYRWTPEQRDWIDLRANLWHTRTAGINKPYPGEGTAFAANSQDRYNRTGADVGNTMRLFGDRVQLAYGMALQLEDLAYVPDHNYGFNQPRDGERRELSAFVAVKYVLLPGLTLDAGIRHTRYTAQDRTPIRLCELVPGENEGTVEVCRLVQPGEEQNRGSAPVVSLVWEPLPGWQLYARRAEALRMPSMFESTSGFSVSPIIGRELKPEHARNQELGTNLLFDGVLMPRDKLRLKLAFFHNKTRDYLTRTIANVDEVDGGWRIRNIDSATFRGFELAGTYDLGLAYVELAGTRYTRIQTCHLGSFRRSSCTDYGIAASYVNNMIPPNWHASATLGGRLLQGRLQMGVRGTFMGQRNRLPGFNDQGVDNVFARPVEWHAYRIYDVFAEYRIRDGLSVSLNVDNVTDRYYLDALGLGAVPAPGRTAKLGMTLQF